MEITTENIKVIITASGAVFVGQEIKEEIIDQEIELNDKSVLIQGLSIMSNKMTLGFPFRFMLDQSSGALRVMAPVLKEKWIKIDMTGSVECDLNPKVEELYRKYCEAEFGSGLVLPDEKRIIL